MKICIILMNILLKWLMTTVAILLGAYFVPGVEVTGIWPALWVALFLGLLNVTLKPILIVLTLPINILTFGLFTFIINTLLVLLISSVVQGFEVTGFLSALIFSLALSIFSYLLNLITNSLN